MNQNIFGNPFLPCLFLSTATFLIIFTPFEIYWTFRDFWYERWIITNSKLLSIKKETLPVAKIRGKLKGLSTLFIESKDQKKIDKLNTILILVHGFSDTKESLQNLYIPLAHFGYTILTYDARGTGRSKRVGRKGDFLSRINDFKNLINWIKEQPSLQKKKIFSIGFSIGALTILSGGIDDKRIEKIIAISAISDYRKNLPTHNPIALISYLLKGVNIFPKRATNERFSPLFQIKKVKNTSSLDEWSLLSKRVFLVHSRNDKIIKFINFVENRDALELPEENVLIFNKGGHNLKKNELALQGAIIRFLMT